MRLSGQIFQSGVRTVRKVFRRMRELIIHLSLSREYHRMLFIPQDVTRKLTRTFENTALRAVRWMELFHDCVKEHSKKDKRRDRDFVADGTLIEFKT